MKLESNLKRRITLAINACKTEYPYFFDTLYESLIRDKSALLYYFEEATKTYDKHDQGSLSFTETLLRQKGYEYSQAITESIEYAKWNRNI